MPLGVHVHDNSVSCGDSCGLLPCSHAELSCRLPKPLFKLNAKTSAKTTPLYNWLLINLPPTIGTVHYSYRSIIWVNVAPFHTPPPPTPSKMKKKTKKKIVSS